jgi:predicted Zn finger-like uncharacterized protein
MLIVCPSCSTSYTIESGSLGLAGRTVRCARCTTTWFVDASTAEMTAVVGAGADAFEAHDFSGVIRPDRSNDHGGSNMEPGDDGAAYLGAGTPEKAAISARTIVAHAPSLVPTTEPSAVAPESVPDEIENFAVRRKRLQARRKQSRRSSRWTALILVLFAFNVALVGARSEVVRFFPQTASLFAAVGLPVNLRNLKFENMRISRETHEGVSSLVVEGSIVSIANKPTEVPRLRFAARDNAGQEVFTWTALPSRSILGPGENMEFRSRFVSPPENAVDVIVRFTNAQ